MALKKPSLKTEDLNLQEAWRKLMFAIDGAIAPKSGKTNERPTNPPVGTMFFDTTIGFPVWYRGGNIWVDATGVPNPPPVP